MGPTYHNSKSSRAITHTNSLKLLEFEFKVWSDESLSRFTKLTEAVIVKLLAMDCQWVADGLQSQLIRIKLIQTTFSESSLKNRLPYIPCAFFFKNQNKTINFKFKRPLSRFGNINSFTNQTFQRSMPIARAIADGIN